MFCTGCGKRMPENVVAKCEYCGMAARNTNSPAQPTVSSQVSNPVTLNHEMSVPSFSETEKAADKQIQPPPSQILAEPESERVSTFISKQGIDIKRALNYYKEDPDWRRKYKKLFLFSFNRYPQTGYYVKVVKNVSKSVELPLPDINFKECNNLGHYYSAPFTLVTVVEVLGIIAIVLFFVHVFCFLIFILIPIWLMIFSVYLTGASILAAMEDNPWLIYNVPRCFKAMRRCISDVVKVSVVINCLYFCNVIFSRAKWVLCSGHLAGQLGRIMKANQESDKMDI